MKISNTVDTWWSVAGSFVIQVFFDCDICLLMVLTKLWLMKTLAVHLLDCSLFFNRLLMMLVVLRFIKTRCIILLES